MKTLTIGTILLAAALSQAACKKKGVAKDTTGPTASGAPDRAGGERTAATASVTTQDGDAAPSTSAVYFEYDSSQLTPAARDQLAQLAEWLRTRPDARVRIEGHTDERGTDEYNLALGERRAHAIRDHLVRLGVNPASLSTISYGEERPAAPGSGEDAWAQNRRGELLPTP
jgi:peptidoglycan-associated lipoprotein